MATDLTPELRTEIEQFLRSGGTGLSHGEVFRGIEDGLTAEQIASAHRTGADNVQALMKSLQHLLVGTIPASRTAARTNAMAYRDLLKRPVSPELADFATARLRRLEEINPDINQSPAPTRSRRSAAKPAAAPAARSEPRLPPVCPDCFEAHAGECV